MATMSSLKLKHLLFLLVLLVACVLSSSHSEADDEARVPRRPRPLAALPKPGFHSFLLALQWPNAHCQEKDVECKPDPPKQSFTIHGLWPLNEFGSARTECEAQAVNDQTFVDLKKDLMEYWPKLENANYFNAGKRFWTRQWVKHGSCSSDKFPPKEYFQSATALGKTYTGKILKSLKDEKIEPDGTSTYSSDTVLAAIKKGIGKDAIISCNTNKNDELQLAEVRLCINADGKTLEACTKPSGTCSKNFIFPSGTPPSPPPEFPSTLTPPPAGLASFARDFLEAVGF